MSANRFVLRFAPLASAFAALVMSMPAVVNARDHDRDRDHRPDPYEARKHHDGRRHDRVVVVRPPVHVDYHRHAVRPVERVGISLSFWSGGVQFFYRDGSWLQPWGGGWRSVMPPVGLVVPVLPVRAVPHRHGHREYFVADGVFYQPVSQGAFQVVAPPVVVARAGQSAVEQEADQQACNRWATTLPEAMADAQVFQDRVGLCMDSRGYTVR